MPVTVERIVNDIGEIVHVIRFSECRHTSAGEREAKQALRRTVLKYKLHQDHKRSLNGLTPTSASIAERSLAKVQSP